MCDYAITLQDSEDEVLIDPLLDLTFGVERKNRPSYSLRENVSPIADLCFSVKEANGQLLGTLRFWPVDIAGEQAILLGPLAVLPTLQGKGIGKALVKKGLEKAEQLGYRLCFVVGEQAYYAPYGFKLAHPLEFDMSVAVSSYKFQVLSLQGEDFSLLPKGVIEPWHDEGLQKKAMHKKA